MLKLEELRKREKLTQAQLAQELGISQRAVAAYELGERRPSTEVAKKLMRIFGLEVNDVWEMFYGTDETSGSERG